MFLKSMKSFAKRASCLAACAHLLDVAIDEAGIRPSFIVLNRIICSSFLAECFRDYTSTTIFRLQPIEMPVLITGKYSQPFSGRMDSCKE